MSLRTVCLGLGMLLGMSVIGNAQAMPSAARPLSGQVGVGYSFVKPDYGYPYIKGFSAYGDIDFHQRVGVEVDAHYDTVFTPTDIGQKTFMLGPRVILVRRDFESRRDFLTFYGKALGGAGIFQYQRGTYSSNPHNETYGAFAVGGGIDLRLSKHLNIRPADFEYQRWPGYGAHSLTPLVSTFGAAYRF